MSNYTKPNYTQIPNTLLDDHLPTMKEAELKVVLAIARSTFGWHKQSDKLSISQLIKMTGMYRQGVVNGLKAGMERGVILRESDGMGFLYSLNVESEPVCEEDQSQPKPVHEKDQSTKKTSPRKRPEPVHEKDCKVVHEKDPQKKYIKEIERKGDTALSKTDEPAPQAESFPPPSENSPTGDPFMDVALKRFQKRQQNNGRHIANRGGQWPDIDAKVSAAERLPLVERLIDMHGLRAAIDLAQDDGKLADMHKLAADLYVMGFKTLADIETVYQRFQKDWRGKTPGGRQLITIASTMKQTTQPSQQSKPMLTLKQWCLQKYYTDNPKFVDVVPEALIYEQYDQYKQQFYQAH